MADPAPLFSCSEPRTSPACSGPGVLLCPAEGCWVGQASGPGHLPAVTPEGRGPPSSRQPGLCCGGSAGGGTSYAPGPELALRFRRSEPCGRSRGHCAALGVAVRAQPNRRPRWLDLITLSWSPRGPQGLWTVPVRALAALRLTLSSQVPGDGVRAHSPAWFTRPCGHGVWGRASTGGHGWGRTGPPFSGDSWCSPCLGNEVLRRRLKQ